MRMPVLSFAKQHAIPNTSLLRKSVFASKEQSGRNSETLLIWEKIFARKNVDSHAKEKLRVFRDNLYKEMGPNLHNSTLNNE